MPRYSFLRCRSILDMAGCWRGERAAPIRRASGRWAVWGCRCLEPECCCACAVREAPRGLRKGIQRVGRPRAGGWARPCMRALWPGAPGLQGRRSKRGQACKPREEHTRGIEGLPWLLPPGCGWRTPRCCRRRRRRLPAGGTWPGPCLGAAPRLRIAGPAPGHARLQSVKAVFHYSQCRADLLACCMLRKGAATCQLLRKGSSSGPTAALGTSHAGAWAALSSGEGRVYTARCAIPNAGWAQHPFTEPVSESLGA
jgi:hypothetical protein